jgi:hypothetical protein
VLYIVEQKVVAMLSMCISRVPEEEDFSTRLFCSLFTFSRLVVGTDRLVVSMPSLVAGAPMLYQACHHRCQLRRRYCQVLTDTAEGHCIGLVNSGI